jgi:ubiquinone/menaquinone biosynthesis C-methylase UbiE
VENHGKDENLDQGVIDSFGHEWAAFDYKETENVHALDAQFLAYCKPIDLNQFDPTKAVAADFGAGSGRWSSRLAPYFSLVYALEPSDGACMVLKKKFTHNTKFQVLQETVGLNSIPDASLDLAVSLGVLHHIPDTSLAIKTVSRAIKPGGYFLCYLYYNLENKPVYYRVLFKAVDLSRRTISKLPQGLKRLIATIITLLIYWPLARISKLLARIGKDTSNFPLHHYADMPFVMLANDALDRFGTTLEQRFSKVQITEMVREAGFVVSTLKFSDTEPFWTFSVRKH